MKARTKVKLYLIIFFILYPNILWAEFVPEETARQAAVNQMNKNIQAGALQRRQKEPPRAAVEQRAAARITEEQISETFTATKDEIFVYYVFNFSPEGWAIISADDAAYPVIAYSESGFYDPNVSNQPPAFTAWMDNVASEIFDAVIGGLSGLPDTVEAWKQLSTAAADFVPDLGTDAMALSVTALIQSTWGQGEDDDWWPWDNDSYNKYCPFEYTDDWPVARRDLCPTGCVATAMAQIMRYWQWPRVGQGSHGYDPPYECSRECFGFDWREVDFSQQYYDWSDSSMPLNTFSDAIDLLMRDIGIAMNMDYTPSGSGASISAAPDAYRTYFRYNTDNPAVRGNYSDTEWINILKAELDDSRPILYRGGPSPGASGHAFVCDGYDSSGSFHFNWGWDGSCDGYFTLDNLTPGGSDFSYDQWAVFGIEPDGRPLEVYVDDNYSAGGGNDGHTWLSDAFNNIQYAMNVVHPGGTVYVGAGTYNEAIDFKGKALRLYGISGPGVTTINGTGRYHVIQCVSGEDANTIIEGFTITGGNANGAEVGDQRGGGMYNYYSSPTVKNCIFRSNIATGLGGGMYNEGYRNPIVTNCTFTLNRSKWGAGMSNTASSYAQVTDCTFFNNTSDNDGGGMFNYYSSPTVTNCTFSGNQAAIDGGGIYTYFSSPTVTNCTFSGNSSASNGGGMYNMGGSLLTITNCTFSGNSSASNGGGMYNMGGSLLTITNCTFSGNEARGNTTDMGGGGMRNDWSNPTVTNCTFSGNWAAWEGGGMRNSNSSPTITNCTFSNNTTPRDGGGMRNHLSSPTLTNCIFSNNTADWGGGMYNYYQSNPTFINCTFTGNSANTQGGVMNNYNSSKPSLTNCILWGNIPDQIADQDSPTSTTTVTYSDVEGGWPDANNTNIDDDPCFANPGNGDYHLKSEAGRWDPNSQTWIKDDVTSPCIDAGDPNSDWIGEYWPHGEHINMGVYGGTPEASASLSNAGNGGDLNLDGGSDRKDMKLFIEKWLYEGLLIEDLSRDGIVNFSDFAIFSHYLELSALNPNPIDGASGVSANADLSWKAGRGAISHDVYLGTSNTPPFIKNQATTTFDPGTMAYTTKYYWRINEVSAYGTVKGAVWSFTTYMAPPPPP